ncbi:MAG: Sigma-E factor negative regulatory protein-like protein [Ramlibacter sp.]|nr:Sigma-E factor negative regulatory protein-like protein [Ramlibacter sp.]
MDKMQTQELISALADGQLQGEAFARGVELAASDLSARQTWHTYHLIGDVLRSGEHAAGTVPTAFLSRLQVRLQAEQRFSAVAADGAILAAARRAESPAAANDASFRWKLVAGFASVAAIAAMGWTVVGGLAAKPEQGQLAAVPGSTVLAESERGVMIRDARLDEFLAAHRQLGGASALQMPAGFLRNATFEGPIR